MSDIVERLNRAGDLAIPGEPCGIYYDAANEIERLRSWMRIQDAVIRSGNVAALTDAERACLEWAEEIAGNCEEFDRVSTLRGLLDRL